MLNMCAYKLCLIIHRRKILLGLRVNPNPNPRPKVSIKLINTHLRTGLFTVFTTCAASSRGVRHCMISIHD